MTTKQEDRELLELAASMSAAKALGQPRYFTGIPCRNGHIAARFSSNGACVECRRIDARAAYAKDPAPKLEKCAQYRARSAEKISEYFRSYYAANRARRSDNYRAYRAANRQREAERHIRYRAANLEQRKAIERAYRSNSREKLRAKHAARRALKRGAAGRYTERDVDRLKLLQRCRCAGCRKMLKSFHVDHIEPLSAGGSNWPENLQLLCPTCNLKKHAKDPISWAQQNGRLL